MKKNINNTSSEWNILANFDINEWIPFCSTDCATSGKFDDYIKTLKGSIEDIKDADIIVITAGVQRKEGMTREDLIGVNGKIMKSVAESVKLHCSKAFVICVSNPLDIMVNVFHKFSNLPHEKICGMAGILDTSRYCSLIADKLKVSAEDVNAVILGGHGDLMVPLQRYTSVNGVPLSEFVKKNMISQNEIQEIIQKTRNMGAEIIKLAKASAAFAPAAAITKMIKSYLYNENNLFTCAVYLNGHYNCSNLFVGSIVTLRSLVRVIKPEQTDALTKEKIFNQIYL